MDEANIILFTKGLGCCDLCSLRYIGLKNNKFYEDPTEFLSKYKKQQDIQSEDTLNIKATEPANADPESPNPDNSIILESQKKANTADTILLESKKIENDEADEPPCKKLKKSICVSCEANTADTILPESKEVENDEADDPPCKKLKKSVCVSCLGILQEEHWSDCYYKVKQVLEEKKYDCNRFACGLSAPMAVILRERAITATIKHKYSDYDGNKITPLKEAWKWSFCDKLSNYLQIVLDSGAVAPLLISLNYDYDKDLEEMGLLSTNPNAKPNRRWCERQCDSLGDTKLAELMGSQLSSAANPALCGEVVMEHVPVYIGGRYLKLSRELSQTPWILNGVRMMESSVQDICFQPMADLFNIDQSVRDSRMKLLSAGREDVDVRCLGNGRPFCIEVSDPRFVPSSEDLQRAAEEINKDGRVVVKNLQCVTKDDLSVLKQGEETKCKTYEAVCVKLSNSKTQTFQSIGRTNGVPITVTQQDIDKLNSFTNSATDGVRITIQQKTPIRVLHRRPLLTRPRIIHSLEAFLIPDRPDLFRMKVVTSAGTYVKEWVHGEFGRTTPSIKDILNCHVDILALDVTDIHLQWP